MAARYGRFGAKTFLIFYIAIVPCRCRAKSWRCKFNNCTVPVPHVGPALHPKYYAEKNATSVRLLGYAFRCIVRGFGPEPLCIGKETAVKVKINVVPNEGTGRISWALRARFGDGGVRDFPEEVGIS
ncbi:Lon protease like protein 2, peroxisomal [Anopheles sinensis]|uniref:Lon protease like protein 2, peroxisomal n=1 Tax=Anopheles sinensis TaxID=74873 RepID=A0A084VN41_ANOSI|nr:Lon protease like protein 2, peroxisomal [Anopheles sinensis]